MSAETYVAEKGDGVYGQWHVPDLLPPRLQDVRLALIFESPYIDEVRSGIPVVGSAGGFALQYMLGASAVGQSLGQFVESQHAAGNSSIAILNTSNVPLAPVAKPDQTGLNDDDWTVLEKVRTSDARNATSMRHPRGNVVGDILKRGLQRRVDDLQLSSDATLVASGVCARRFLRSFRTAATHVPLEVRHPSRRNWQKDPCHPGLQEVRRLFSRYS